MYICIYIYIWIDARTHTSAMWSHTTAWAAQNLILIICILYLRGEILVHDSYRPKAKRGVSLKSVSLNERNHRSEENAIMVV